MANAAVMRIQRELQEFSKSTENHLIHLQPDEHDIRHIYALIVGPPQSPYAFGLFLFELWFPEDYPNSPPKVNCITTSHGKVRFNPNIYSKGKVCLSILGTWQGSSAEMWSPVQSISSVLLSIQSLLCDTPFHNEPGFETDEENTGLPKKYNAKITHETIRVSVCDQLEEIIKVQPKANPNSIHDEVVARVANASSGAAVTAFLPCPPSVVTRSGFSDTLKRQFLRNFDIYQEIVEAQSKLRELQEPFTMMPFEEPSNQMAGVFDFDSIRSRLKDIHDGICAENLEWESEGVVNFKNRSRSAMTLLEQFDKGKKELPDGADIGLRAGNPFVWEVSLFGETCNTPYCHQLRVIMSNNFPDVLPRVQFVTEVLHPQVTSAGIPCYQIALGETGSVVAHIAAIAALLVESPSTNPALHANPAAAALLNGTESEVKEYKRRVRRLAEKSLEG